MLQNVKELDLGEITLKKMVNNQNKWTIIAFASLIFGILYKLSGAISYKNGVILTLLDFEEKIPLIPSTIWIYIVLYPIYLIWSLTTFKDENNMNKLLYSFLLLTLISCAIFISFPLNYPREYYPLLFSETISHKLLQYVRLIDKPSNCFPSLHVGLCFLFAFIHKNESKKRYVISLLISFSIAISTLTTKQHYFYDLVGGFILSFTIVTLMNKVSFAESISLDNFYRE